MEGIWLRNKLKEQNYKKSVQHYIVPVATLIEAPTRVANRSVAASPGHGKGLDRRLGCCHVREMWLRSSHVRFMRLLWAFRRRRLAGLLQGTSSIRRLAIELHGQRVPVGVPWHG